MLILATFKIFHNKMISIDVSMATRMLNGRVVVKYVMTVLLPTQESSRPGET